MGERGPESDVNLLIKQLSKFDKKQKFQGDKGYQGAERTTIPKKKPRKQELPAEIKEDNLKLAQKRIFVEHISRAYNKANKNIWTSTGKIQIKTYIPHFPHVVQNDT